MANIDPWQRLVEFLDDWTSAEVVAPGRLKVTVPGGERFVVIVMNEDDWSSMSGVAYGAFVSAAEAVRDAFDALKDEHLYLVYDRYALEPSATPELPPDPEDIAMQEFLRQHPRARGGWFAHDPSRSTDRDTS